MRYSTGCSDSASTTVCHVCVYVACATQLNALGEAAYHVVKAWTLFDISRQGVIRKYVHALALAIVLRVVRQTRVHASNP